MAERSEMNTHSVIDLNADENADAIRAYNLSAMELILQDMCEHEGIADTEAEIDAMFERIKAGVN